jgi:hypothetical protein
MASAELPVCMSQVIYAPAPATDAAELGSSGMHASEEEQEPATKDASSSVVPFPHRASEHERLVYSDRFALAEIPSFGRRYHANYTISLLPWQPPGRALVLGFTYMSARCCRTLPA